MSTNTRDLLKNKKGKKVIVDSIVISLNGKVCAKGELRKVWSNSQARKLEVSIEGFALKPFKTFLKTKAKARNFHTIYSSTLNQFLHLKNQLDVIPDQANNRLCYPSPQMELKTRVNTLNRIAQLKVKEYLKQWQ